MKKNLRIKNLDCAVCAGKMESLIKKIAGVNDCSISFMTGKVIIDCEDNITELEGKVLKAIKKIDSCCELV